MLFNCGIGNAAMRCDGCGHLHHQVSVGEETVICGCGAVIAFREGQDHYEYYTMSRRYCQKTLEFALNEDKRNWC